MDNQEKPATLGTQDKEKHNKNTTQQKIRQSCIALLVNSN